MKTHDVVVVVVVTVVVVAVVVVVVAVVVVVVVVAVVVVVHLLSPNGNQTGIKRETREKHEKHTERYGKHTGNIRRTHGKRETNTGSARQTRR